ncbi:MAG TPA: HRDC domain-containing protein, partial [Edaphobacter sp.]|nr:HRDC domain-containing protein [Edaphobacter sp.]
TVDMAGNVCATEHTLRKTAWRKGYDDQIAFRRDQIDRMVQFAESPQCRMAALIQHFGDTADGLRPCGHCDFCAPQNATAQTFRPPTTEEERQLRAILRALENSAGQTRATGKLHTELSTAALRNTPAADRKIFDTLLDALTRAGLITLNQDQWTNPEGNLINYKKASLTHEGRTLTGPLPPDLLLKDISANTASTSSRKKSGNASSPKSSKTSLKAEREQATATYTADQKSLEAALRAWRKAEAAKTGKPAFIVFSDSVLHNLVIARPATLAELHTVAGIGSEKVDRYGADITAICRSEATATLALNNKEASSRPKQSEAERSLRSARTMQDASRLPTNTASTETFTRLRITTPEPDILTTEQHALDKRLRDWRKAESEKLNLPLFFIIASTTLRSIVLARPQNLAQLKTIQGLAHEKIEQFGSAILDICTA